MYKHSICGKIHAIHPNSDESTSRTWQRLHMQQLRQQHNYKNTSGVDVRLKARHSAKHMHKTWAILEVTGETKTGNWYVNSMQRWHSDERVAFSEVVGNDDFYNTVTRVTVTSQLSANRERSITAKTHGGHTDTHIHTHQKGETLHAEQKKKEKCKCTPKSIMRFPT